VQDDDRADFVRRPVLENLIREPSGDDYALASVALRGATGAVRDLAISEQEAAARLQAVRTELAAARERLREAEQYMREVTPRPPWSPSPLPPGYRARPPADLKGNA
jgi:hypothetical protein